MTKDELRKVVDGCVQAAEAGDDAAVWTRMAPLLEGWRGDLETARFLAVALTSFRGSTERRIELASELVAASAHDRVLLSILG